jgi:biotin carboxyl carrier protein
VETIGPTGYTHLKYTAIVNEDLVDVEFERHGTTKIEARIGDRAYVLDAQGVEPGVYWFNWNHRSIEATVTPNGGGFTVSIADARFAVEILDSRKALKKAAQVGHDGIAEIRAPMPGKIVKVLLSEGSEVAANEGILVMEAMKMQNEIKSPKKGVVRKLNVAEGMAVNSGDLLVSVE